MIMVFKRSWALKKFWVQLNFESDKKLFLEQFWVPKNLVGGGGWWWFESEFSVHLWSKALA